LHAWWIVPRFENDGTGFARVIRGGCVCLIEFQIRRIVRPTDVPDTGLLCDLLWSDPDKVKRRKEKKVIGQRWLKSFCTRMFEDGQKTIVA
jgi:hypothetical protein